MRPKIILVGGFLGAGKTTLILRAADLLLQQRKRVAVVTNDQDAGLVDTRFSEANGFVTREVAGGCFCCRFSTLIDAAEHLRSYAPEILFAEPVGSCIDLAATIIQPLLTLYSTDLEVAALTVLADPQLAAQVFAGEADQDVAYLFRQQIAEADLLCLTKADQHSDAPQLPVPVDYCLSAVSGQGIDEWLDDILSGARIPGTRLLDVDYDRYTQAEAALGWVNVQVDVALRQPLSPATLVGPLAESLEAALSTAGFHIAHLKVFDRCRTGLLKVSICRNGDEGVPDGDLLTSPDLRHELVINLRAIGPPEELQVLVHQALRRIDGRIVARHSGAFRPAPTKPQHRFPEIVP